MTKHYRGLKSTKRKCKTTRVISTTKTKKNEHIEIGNE